MRLFLLLLAACCLPCTAVGEEAGPTPRDLAKAQQQLAARLDAAEVGAVPPLLSDAADAALLRAALDPRGLRPVTADGLGEGLDTCDVANRYNVTLSLVGSRENEFKGVPEAQATKTITARMRVNVVRYQDELALSLRFAAACMARLVEPAAQFWKTLPDSERTQARLEGLRDVRGGMVKIYVGLVMMQIDPANRPANQTLLMEALLSNNARLAQAMTPADRQQVIDVIAGYLPSATGEAKADLTRLRDELASLPCTQLCALG